MLDVFQISNVHSIAVCNDGGFVSKYCVYVQPYLPVGKNYIVNLTTAHIFQIWCEIQPPPRNSWILLPTSNSRHAWLTITPLRLSKVAVEDPADGSEIPKPPPGMYSIQNVFLKKIKIL